DIAAALGKPPGTIRQLLWKMLREKTPCIKVDDRRRYHALPPSHNADNADNAGAGGGDESAWEADGSEDDGVTGGVTGESSDNAQETGTEPLAAWPDDTGVTGVTGVTGSTVASPLSKSDRRRLPVRLPVRLPDAELRPGETINAYADRLEAFGFTWDDAVPMYYAITNDRRREFVERHNREVKVSAATRKAG